MKTKIIASFLLAIIGFGTVTSASAMDRRHHRHHAPRHREHHHRGHHM